MATTAQRLSKLENDVAALNASLIYLLAKLAEAQAKAIIAEG